MNKVVVNGVDCSPGVVAELRSQLAAAESRAERLLTVMQHLLKAFLTLHRACGTGSAWRSRSASRPGDIRSKTDAPRQAARPPRV